MSDPLTTSLQTTVRRAYGRGYHDAMRALTQEQDMNQARLEEAERSLSGVAQKVLEATPKSEHWTISQIVGEMRRSGKNLDLSVVAGCLATLLKSGLVREPQTGSFIRVLAKPKTQLMAVAADAGQGEESPGASTPAKPDERDTLAKLADLSAGVRAMALQFTDLAHAIDDVAIEVEERMLKINADSEKLAQLRKLLTGIGA